MPHSATIIQELDSAITQAPPQRRSEILRQITSLFLAQADHCTDDEIALFDDVISYLVAEIEVAARAMLAAQLAPVANAPPRVIRMLACDDAIEVAGPVLTLSERLDDATLVEAASTKGQQHLLAISHRRSLSEAVTDVLVVRGDRTVVLSTVANAGARFSDHGFAVLVSRAACDDALAETVAKRREIPLQLFLKLLATASDKVRAKLEAEHPRARQEVHRVVSHVANRVREQVMRRTLDYAQAEKRVRARLVDGTLTESDLTAFARTGHLEETTVALAIMCDLPLEAVERALLDERTETLLIIARAARLSWLTVKALLRLHAGPHGISASETEQCLAHFERIKPETAEQLVRFHRMRCGQGYRPQISC